jgi:HemY protein
MASREAVYLLLADIEEAETGDQGRVRHWMAQALRAHRDPAWVADGVVSENWLPLSPVTGRLDAFEWKVPFGQLEGPVEEGSLAREQALATLPPVTVKTEIKEEPRKPEVVKTAIPEPKKLVVETPIVAATPANNTSIDQVAKPIAVPKAEKPDVAVAAKTPAPANVPQPATKTPQNAEEPVPFFGRPPDDPGVKETDAEKSPTRLRLF